MTNLPKKKIENSLSKIQSRLADAQELIITAGKEVEKLYIELEEAPNNKEGN